MADEIISNPFEDEDFEDGDQQYRTYKMDLRRKRVGGFIDDREAVAQAIWKILSTVRFAHLIYDDQYGCDFFNKINEPGLTEDYIRADMPTMLEDALLTDPRISGVEDFSYKILGGDSVEIYFTAETIYGDLNLSGVIKNDD